MMMKQWEQENMDEQFNEQFANEWGKQWEQEVVPQQDVIPFQPKNEYMDNTGDRLAIAK